MNETISIKKQTYFYVYSNALRILIALGVNAILSRLLNSYDFGIATIISVFSTFFITISDVGISPAIVQIKELTKEDTDNIFSFTILVGFISAIFFIVLSIPVSLFYENNIYINLFFWLSISVFFGVINMVPSGLLNKDKKFITLSIRNIVCVVISATIAIILAVNGFGVYSLVAQSVISSFVSFAFDYLFTKPYFKITFNFPGVNKIFKYSGFLFVFNIVCYLSRTIDDLLTGKFISTSELGYYSKAYTVMLYPVDNLAGVFSPVIHPVLSDYQNDYSKIFDKYILISRLLFLVGGFVSIGCFVCSEEIINIICGANWDKTILCFKAMSFAILPQMLNSCVSAVYKSIGNSKLLLFNSIVNTCFSFMAIIIAVFVFKNIIVLSITITIVYYFHYFTAHIMLLVNGLKISVLEYFSRLKKELFILCITVTFVLLFRINVSSIILSFAYKMISIFLIYFFMILLTGDYKMIRDFFIIKRQN